MRNVTFSLNPQKNNLIERKEIIGYKWYFNIFTNFLKYFSTLTCVREGSHVSIFAII